MDPQLGQGKISGYSDSFTLNNFSIWVNLLNFAHFVISQLVKTTAFKLWTEIKVSRFHANRIIVRSTSDYLETDFQFSSNF